MKNVFLSGGLLFSICALAFAVSPAQTNGEVDAEKQIEHTVRLLFESIKQRDVDEIRQVVSQKLMAIKSGDSATVGVIDTDDVQQLLPPPRNDDWDAISLTNFDVNISQTNTSVATVSFTLSRKLDDQSLARVKKLLDNSSADLPLHDRNRLARQVVAGAAENDLFAMVARQKGEWRIVCLSLPR